MLHFSRGIFPIDRTARSPQGNRLMNGSFAASSSETKASSVRKSGICKISTSMVFSIGLKIPIA